MNAVIKHYNMLIDENNDPVLDTLLLKEHMARWDGELFFNALCLDNHQNALEIGVGTGRLAIKIAPLCKSFTGIDLSPKTIKRAKLHLEKFNPILICADFNKYDFKNNFDLIYSSLTFMHIKNKENTINKIYSLLNDNGRFVLSIDKNQNTTFSCNGRTLKLYPDDRYNTEKLIRSAGFNVKKILETDFAYIFVSEKSFS